jgi:HK97 family phage prohead protease
MNQHYIARPFALKALSADGGFRGYGSVFGVVDAMSDVVAPNAFDRSLAAHRRANTMPAMLWQHDSRRPIGVWQNIAEDKAGLRVDGQLALRTQSGAEAYELLKLGALNGLSIGYLAVASSLDERTGRRTLTEIDLWEVSLVTFPANPAARVTAIKHETPNDQAIVAALAHELDRYTRDLNQVLKGQ